jgi:hypothetical protein
MDSNASILASNFKNPHIESIKVRFWEVELVINAPVLFVFTRNNGGSLFDFFWDYLCFFEFVVDCVDNRLKVFFLLVSLALLMDIWKVVGEFLNFLEEVVWASVHNKSYGQVFENVQFDAFTMVIHVFEKLILRWENSMILNVIH